jgi:hypothetical protein
MDSHPLLSVKTKTKAKAKAKAKPKAKNETSSMQRPNATNHKCINVCRDAKF